MRTRVLGPGASPLPVVGPRPLRRVLAAVSALEPMAFRYVDTLNTVPGEAPPAQVRAPAPERRPCNALGQPVGSACMHVPSCATAWSARPSTDQGCAALLDV